MTARSRARQDPNPIDLAALLRLIAEAPDQRAFFAALRQALPALLPDARVDLLVGEGPGSSWRPLAGERGRDPPAGAARSDAGFKEWIARQGYALVEALPLDGAGQRLGWLTLARQGDAFGAGELAAAGQLAALVTLRLLYERSRDNLASRDEQVAQLERRLGEHEEVRLRATLAVGAAHDIGNLFTSVLGHAQILQQDAPQPLQRDLRAIAQAAGDGHFLLRRMLSLKTPPPVAGAAVMSVSQLIQDALALTRPFWEKRPAITIRTALAHTPPVRAHAAELREVLVNLIINAIGAMPEGGTLTLRSFVADTRVHIEVSDTGHGISREHQSTIFQPFTTTRESGRGLGLSVSRAIVEGYGGTLTVRSAPGQGATFALALPAVRVRDIPPSPSRRRAAS